MRAGTRQFDHCHKSAAGAAGAGERRGGAAAGWVESEPDRWKWPYFSHGVMNLQALAGGRVSAAAAGHRDLMNDLGDPLTTSNHANQ